VAYASQAGTVFVSNERGTGDTAVDGRGVRRIGDVNLGEDIGNSQYDPSAGALYVAVGGNNQLVTIDPARMAILDREDLEGCSGAHGVQVDAPPRHRVFVACENNDSMVVFDLTAKRVSQTFRVGKGPDVQALDAASHQLYVAAESGELAVFDTTGDSVTKVGQGNAGPDAHSDAVDPVSHVVYLLRPFWALFC